MIERIGGAGDPRLSDYAHVGDPVWLRAHDLFVAEGRLVVQRLLASGRFRVRSILLTPSALGALQDSAGHLPVFVSEPPIVNAITGFKFHRGCLALAERPAATALEDLYGATRLLALEGVGNPDNIGGLFRVGAAFGAAGVVLDPASGDPLYRKAIRTSMGAALALPFARANDWPAALTRLREEGFTVAALTPRPDAPTIAEVARHRRDRLVLVVGAEGPGLSDAALGEAHVLVRIPMSPGVDSLNVTVAAGIALSHLA